MFNTNNGRMWCNIIKMVRKSFIIICYHDSHICMEIVMSDSWTCSSIFQRQSIYLGSLFLFNFISFLIFFGVFLLYRNMFYFYFFIHRIENIYGFFLCVTIGKSEWKEIKNYFQSHTRQQAPASRRKWMASQIKKDEKWQKHGTKKRMKIP